MTQKLDAVLFDMDGLLFDTERLALRAWRQAAAETGLGTLDEGLLLQMVGLSGSANQQLLAEGLGSAETAQTLYAAKRACYLHMVQNDTIPLKPGAQPLLQWLARQDMPCGLATSSQRALVDLLLARTGFAPYFPVVVAGDDVAHSKPAPDVYLRAAGLLHATPQRCIVLEDSVHGLNAGIAAGMRVILVPDLIAPPREAAAQAQAVCGDLHAAQQQLQALLCRA